MKTKRTLIDGSHPSIAVEDLAELVPAVPTHLLPEMMLRRQAVEALVGMQTSTLLSEVSRGRFPRPVRISPKLIGWRAADVIAWSRSRPDAMTPDDLEQSSKARAVDMIEQVRRAASEREETGNAR